MSSSASRLGHVRALDGLRGLAIALVIGCHYWLTPHGGGTAGVNLFFVLSGFLITTLLLEEYLATGRISLPKFYVRRTRRLIPALLVLLAAVMAGAALKRNLGQFALGVLLQGFYTANFAAVFEPRHYVLALGPLWSLSLEEQFYLVWPAILVLLLRFHARRRLVIAALAVLIVADWVWRIWLSAHGAGATRIMVLPDTHSDAILAGVLLAYLPRRQLDQGVALIACFLLAVACVGPIEAVNGPIIDLAGMGLVWFAVQEGSWISRAASWQPLVKLGVISYSLYLWHLVVLYWFAGRDTLVSLAVSVAAATLSFRFVEQRFRRRRTRQKVDSVPAMAAVGNS